MFCGFLVTSTSCLHGGLASSLPAALPWTPPLPFLVPPSGPSPNQPYHRPNPFHEDENMEASQKRSDLSKEKIFYRISNQASDLCLFTQIR
ncbi:hypothetical protein STEG23_036722 [Scotinomys teguina]